MATEQDGLQVEIGVTEKRYLAQLAKLEAQTVKAAKRTEQNWRRANGGASRSFRSLERGFRKTSGAASNFTGGMRNVSLQLSQVGQQAMATGDPLRALAIQLPDLTLGFGTLGIALGVVAGALLPMAAEFVGIGAEAVDLGKVVDELGKAVARYEGAVQNAKRPTSELREEYGEFAEAARELFIAQRELEKLDALGKLRDARAVITDQFGSLLGVTEDFAKSYSLAVERLEELNRPQVNEQGIDVRSDRELAAQTREAEALQSIISRVRPAIAQVKEELQLSDEAAGEFLAALVNLRDAATLEEQQVALARVRELYAAAVSASGTLTVEQEANLRAILEAESGLLGLVSAMSDAETGTAATADQARLLADEVARAAQAALDFVANLGSASLAGLRAEVAALEAGGGRSDAAVARREAEVRSSPEFQAAMAGPEGLRQQAIAGLERELELTREEVVLRERKAEALREQGKASGGAASAAENLTAAERIAKQVIEGAIEGAVRYSDVIEILRQKLESGEISQETFNAAIEGAEKKFAEMGETATGLESGISRLFDSIIDGGEGAIDVVRDLIAQMIKMQFMTGLAEGLPGIFGAGGILPLVKSARGNVIDGGRVVPFANGGVVSGPTHFPMRGATGLMGESGPEAILPLTRIGGKLGVRAEGRGPTQMVEINNYSGAQVRQREGSGVDGQRVILDIVSDGMASGALDKSQRGRFGAAPRTKRR